MNSSGFSVPIGPYRLWYTVGRPYSERYIDLLRAHGVLVEEFDLREDPNLNVSLTVGKEGHDWPLLLVAQGSEAHWDGETRLCVALVVETDTLFIGAHDTLLAYDLSSPRLLWEDTTLAAESWSQHGEMMLLSTELDLLAWDTHGRRKWVAYAEPPWTYEVEGETVHMTVLDHAMEFPLQTGPSWGSKQPWVE